MKGSRLSRWVIKTIAAKVRAGSYPWPAARSLGRIENSTFWEWIGIGREYALDVAERINAGESPDVPDDKPERGLTREELCYELFVAVEQTLGGAEVENAEWLFKNEPAKWLQLGPAKGNWKPESKTIIEGQIEHDMSLEIQCPAPLKTITEGVEILESVGIPLADGRTFRQIGTKPRDEPKVEPSDDNGTAK